MTMWIPKATDTRARANSCKNAPECYVIVHCLLGYIITTVRRKHHPVAFTCTFSILFIIFALYRLCWEKNYYEARRNETWV
jgi:hypothetical protein